MYETKQIQLRNVRLSFPNLFKPKQNFDANGQPSGDAKYSASFLIDASTEEGQANYKAIINEMKACHESGYKGMPRLKATCLKAQDEGLIEKHKYVTGTEGAMRDEYNGHFILSSSERKAVQLLHKRRKGQPDKIVQESDNVLYSGCYVNAIISLWPQDNAYGKRINSNLVAVMHRSGGEAFSSAGSFDSSAFDEFDDEDDDFLNDETEFDDIPF